MKQKLHKIISEKVFVENKNEQIELFDDPDKWLFDFRRVIMRGNTADLISKIFIQTFKNKYPFQIGTIEIAGVPLMSSIVTSLYKEEYTDINGFFIRKSRKKSGLMKMVEGEILENVPIILVDDLMNAGNSFWRQVEVLENLGHKVHTVWSILRFRDDDYYKRFHNRDIQVQSVFTLDDFTEVLGEKVANLVSKDSAPPKMPFESIWAYNGPNPTYKWVVQKSQPVIDKSKIYFGADDERFRALNQKDGSLAWEYRVGKGSMKKSIFSSPALYKNLIIFGSYDGNVYALDKETGKRKWMFLEADWVGSSPAVVEDLGLVFVGLEFGLFRKRGGIVALKADSGEKIWGDYTHPALTHCSPHYIKKWLQVVIGSNDGVVRLYDAKTGMLLWTFTTFGGASYKPERDGGFGQGDIKESFVYSDKHDFIIFGSIDGFLYVLERKTGYLVYHYKCEFGIWSTPVIYKNRVYFSSVDKRLRCMDLDTFKLIFEVNVDNTRIFASPTIINGLLYIGTNAARLHELDTETGEKLGYFQATERITNHLMYNPKTKQYFLPTYANQIICLERKDSSL